MQKNHDLENDMILTRIIVIHTILHVHNSPKKQKENRRKVRLISLGPLVFRTIFNFLHFTLKIKSKSTIVH